MLLSIKWRVRETTAVGGSAAARVNLTICPHDAMIPITTKDCTKDWVVSTGDRDSMLGRECAKVPKLTCVDAPSDASRIFGWLEAYGQVLTRVFLRHGTGDQVLSLHRVEKSSSYLSA